MLSLALFLVGCSDNVEDTAKVDKDKITVVTKDTDSKNNDNSTKDVEKNFAFTINNITITIGDEAEDIIDELGKPKDCFESSSVTYQGVKTYCYNGFEVTTYIDKGIEYIASVLLVDNSVTTDEGIYIGSNLKDVINAYGNNYLESTGQYSYTKGDSELQFSHNDDKVVSILYIKKI